MLWTPWLGLLKRKHTDCTLDEIFADRLWQVNLIPVCLIGVKQSTLHLRIQIETMKWNHAWCHFAALQHNQLSFTTTSLQGSAECSFNVINYAHTRTMNQITSSSLSTSSIASLKPTACSPARAKQPAFTDYTKIHIFTCGAGTNTRRLPSCVQPRRQLPSGPVMARCRAWR